MRADVEKMVHTLHRDQADLTFDDTDNQDLIIFGADEILLAS